MQCPEGINGSTPMDIVAVIDISGSMDSAATVEQGGKQVGFSRVSNASMFCYPSASYSCISCAGFRGFHSAGCNQARGEDAHCIHASHRQTLHRHFRCVVIYIYACTNPATCHIID